MARLALPNRLPRRLPRMALYALLVALALAIIDCFSGSIVPSSRADDAPKFVLPALPVGIEGEWTTGPRECDVLAGISSDCVFMD